MPKISNSVPTVSCSADRGSQLTSAYLVTAVSGHAHGEDDGECLDDLDGGHREGGDRQTHVAPEPMRQSIA